MLTFSNVDNKINKKTTDLFCSYTMTSSYMGGPSYTATIYCNPGDNQQQQQDAVHGVAKMFYFIFGI